VLLGGDSAADAVREPDEEPLPYPDAELLVLPVLALFVLLLPLPPQAAISAAIAIGASVTSLARCTGSPLTRWTGLTRIGRPRLKFLPKTSDLPHPAKRARSLRAPPNGAGPS
jgi:hypothetical protein